MIATVGIWRAVYASLGAVHAPELPESDPCIPDKVWDFHPHAHDLTSLTFQYDHTCSSTKLRPSLFGGPIYNDVNPCFAMHCCLGMHVSLEPSLAH